MVVLQKWEFRDNGFSEFFFDVIWWITEKFENENICLKKKRKKQNSSDKNILTQYATQSILSVEFAAWSVCVYRQGFPFSEH